MEKKKSVTEWLRDWVLMPTVFVITLVWLGMAVSSFEGGRIASAVLSFVMAVLGSVILGIVYVAKKKAGLHEKRHD